MSATKLHTSTTTTTTTTMEPKPGLSQNDRTLSAGTLKERLSKLAVTPLHVTKPVAALHASVG